MCQICKAEAKQDAITRRQFSTKGVIGLLMAGAAPTFNLGGIFSASAEDKLAKMRF